ncbi:MAG: cysteine dioxygenase family protein [Solirubrobacterales bacterium]
MIEQLNAKPAELGEAELRQMAGSIADRPELWRHLVRHDPEERAWERIFRNDAVEAYVICWMDGHDTGFHDHDVSRGALAVAEGAVREERLALGGSPIGRVLGGGQSLSFGASDIHRVLHAGGRPSTTIHVYSPPIRQMGQYEIGENGVLLRHARGEDEELRSEAAAESALPAASGWS